MHEWFHEASDKEGATWWSVEKSAILATEKPVKQLEPRWREPRRLNLLAAVNECNGSHLRAGIFERRFPVEFKSDAYHRYKDYSASAPAPSAAGEVGVTWGASPGDVGSRRVVRPLRVEVARAGPPPERSGRDIAGRMERGELCFYDDYIEAQIAQDHCRLFKTPFVVPRHDWGGENYWFGRKIARKPPEEPDEFKSDLGNQSDSSETSSPFGACPRQVYDLILQATDIDNVQAQELLRGEIPSLFGPTGFGLQQLHPKDRLVSFYNLRTFGCMIDAVTRCPLIHMEVQNALQGPFSAHAEPAPSQTRLDAGKCRDL
ncbi:hypothetical protein BdWA1_000959 [Babesia duncani]|uniref:Uncharacterized protein n=1 Tax=Babesia duncani TaxID=323732 RepID=A0AAD9PNI9_9APIC|nr:hypothetical protein BdWA1_000959 [Babesia duncani]